MPFKRELDSSDPKVWDEWERDGVKWVIQDVPPEDDDLVVQIMAEKFIKEEIICSTANVSEDPVSVELFKAVWGSILKLRLSLGCYAEEDGKRTLAAVNCCYVKQKDDSKLELSAESWKQVGKAMEMVEADIDAFSLVGDDKYLYGLGLYVVSQFRGAGLGVRVLQAREPLCRHLGVAGTFTVFTGPASQKAADRAGFTLLSQISMKDMAEAGLKFPRDETKIIKYMWKKF